MIMLPHIYSMCMIMPSLGPIAHDDAASHVPDARDDAASHLNKPHDDVASHKDDASHTQCLTGARTHAWSP